LGFEAAHGLRRGARWMPSRRDTASVTAPYNSACASR
jgi:hypothetical protein